MRGKMERSKGVVPRVWYRRCHQAAAPPTQRVSWPLELLSHTDFSPALLSSLSFNSIPDYPERTAPSSVSSGNQHRQRTHVLGVQMMSGLFWGGTRPRFISEYPQPCSSPARNSTGWNLGNGKGPALVNLLFLEDRHLICQDLQTVA